MTNAKFQWVIKIYEEKEHMTYLKLQLFLFFSEALSSFIKPPKKEKYLWF